MSNVSEMSLLSILQREDDALKGIKYSKKMIEKYKVEQREEKEERMKNVYICLCQDYIMRGNEWLQKLNEARSDLKEYFRHFGIDRETN